MRQVLLLSILFISYVFGGSTDCYDCLSSSSKKACYNGGTMKCCSGSDCFTNTNVTKSSTFCSDMAQTSSMKYLFCPYSSSYCMSSDPLLRSVMNAKQTMFTPVNSFNMHYSCYWAVTPPNEYQPDVILKIKIEKLYNTDCYLNFGGSIVTADS